MRHAPAARLTIRDRRCPLYDYDCASCGQRFEVLHGVHADGPTACPLCGGGPMRKAITRPGVHFKGSGWAKKERRATATPSASKSPRRRVRRGTAVERWRIAEGGAGGRAASSGDRPARARRRRPVATPKQGDGDSGAAGLDRLTDGRAADWITLAEAAEILGAANVHFTPATIGGWARAGRSRASSSAAAGTSAAARSGRSSPPRAASAPTTSSPVLFEDLGG